MQPSREERCILPTSTTGSNLWKERLLIRMDLGIGISESARRLSHDDCDAFPLGHLIAELAGQLTSNCFLHF